MACVIVLFRLCKAKIISEKIQKDREKPMPQIASASLCISQHLSEFGSWISKRCHCCISCIKYSFVLENSCPAPVQAVVIPKGMALLQRSSYCPLCRCTCRRGCFQPFDPWTLTLTPRLVIRTNSARPVKLVMYCW